MTSSSVNSFPQTNSSQAAKVDPFEVGWLFVQEYYTFLNREPERLHCFYNKKSLFTHGHEAENAKTYNGQTEIHEFIKSLNFEDCKVLVSQVDSQASQDGGIIIQVLGEMSNKGGASHKFAQTFFLAEQPSGYYVLNDIFRYLKEDIDNEYEESADPTAHGVDRQPHLPQVTAATVVPTDFAINDVVVPDSAVTDGFHHKPSQASSVAAAVRSPSPAKPRSKSPVKASLQDQPSVTGTANETTFSGDWDKSVVEQAAAAVQSAPAVSAAAVAPSNPPAASKQPAWGKKPPAPVQQSSSTVSGSQPSKKGGSGQQSAAQTSQTANAAPAPASTAPKSWANLVSSNDKQAKPSGLPPPPVLGSKAVSDEKDTSSSEFHPVPSNRQRRNNNNNNNDKNNQENSSDHQQGGHHHKEGSTTRTPEEKDKHSIYIKHLAEGTTEKQVRATFNQLGDIRNVDVLFGKNIAFVEFVNIDSVAKAIGNPFGLNGNTIVPEERRRHHYGGNSGGGRNNRSGWNNQQGGNQRRGGGGDFGRSSSNSGGSGRQRGGDRSSNVPSQSGGGKNKNQQNQQQNY